MLEQTIYGNTVEAWLIALVAGLLAIGAVQFVRTLLARRLQALTARTTNELDDIAVDTLRATRGWFLLLVGVWAASLVVVLSPFVANVVRTAAILGAMVQVGVWGGTAIGSWVERFGEKKLEAGEGASVTTMRAIAFIARIGLWSVVLIAVLDNLGVDITGLVAGLGVGGIAVALAVQNVLGDLFASFSIVLDKPFVAGDFIIVGELAGTVEKVGLKTTRVRSLSGEQLVFANSDLLNSRIRNYKRMFERRVVFSFGLIYQTPYETLKRIPGMVREIIEAQEHTRFDRAHFHRYGDSSLDFEVVYYVLVPDYAVYMDIQQAINLEMFRRFEQESVEFAYPTRTLFVENAASAPAAPGGRA